MKYQGSKRKIVKELLPFFLNEMKNGRSAFLDLFCGGCSVIEQIPSKYRRIANDKNKYLIAMWEHLTNFGYGNLPLKIERDFYCDVRDSYNTDSDKYSDDIKGWVGFMASFNGRFFDGGYSGHSVRSRDYIRENINNTLNQVPLLKNVEWRSVNYWEVDLPHNSLIYCDPPYKDTKKYPTSKDFDYEFFYQWCRSLKDSGNKVFISEYNMPDDFVCVWEKKVTVSMNQYITKKPIERLFTI